jgi:hypothetical protein
MAIKTKSSKKPASKKAPAKKAPAKKTAATKGTTIRCQKWLAIHDFMPLGTPTLRVTGVCFTPTPGYKIKLVPAVPQGINPLILILKKIVTPPTGIQPQVITRVDVRFEKKTRTRYTHVTILPDGTTIKVQNVT